MSARHILAGTQKDFPVVDNLGEVMGILTHATFFQALSEHGDDYPVTSAMTEEFDTAEARNRWKPSSTVPKAVVARRFRSLRTVVSSACSPRKTSSEFVMIQAARKRFG